MNEKSIYEIITDGNDLDNVVLADEQGNETEFEQVATLATDKGMFCILCPLDEKGAASDEGVVFRLDAQNCDSLELVTDEQTIDDVFALYEKLCEE